MSSVKIRRIEETLNRLKSDKKYPDDKRATACIREAIKAVREGNFGAGCVIVNAKDRVVSRGRNQLIYPNFRSDRHAEMVAMDHLEKANPRSKSMRGYTLFTSLEPCPMCMGRLIIAGCGTVRYVADDPKGGMVRRRNRLPGVFPKLAARQRWERARCSPILRKLAWQVFESNADELNARLARR